MDNKVNAILEGLNDEQKKAVCCTEGPILIVAGAGSGKTRVLTSRLAYLLSGGTAPENILALTFTKKAANEMKERVALMVGAKSARRVVMGTFHSVFVRFLRDYAEFLGYPQHFTIYDTGDSLSAVKTCIRELELDDKVYKPKDVLSRISSAKNNLVTPSGYKKNNELMTADAHVKKPHTAEIYELYQNKLKQNGVMDFDDLLLNTNILLRDNQEALFDISSRFTHIMVDEYQDTNYSQYLILKKLAQFHHNICVVGDDSQSIYAFRGAKIENILNFRKDYPESRIFRLERNYRSTSNIVNAANSLISKNKGRIPKECYSMGGDGEKIRLMKTFNETEEAAAIVGDIMARMRRDSARYEDFAVLYRTNAQARVVEEQLRRRNIPYMIYSGNSFFEHAEVKDMMAYFKLVVNVNDDESFRRIVNRPTRGIGDTTLAVLANAALNARTTLFRAVWLDNLEAGGMRPAALKRLREFCTLIGELNAKVMTTDAFRLAQEIADRSGLYAMYKADLSFEGQARTANVEELVSSVAAFVEERLEDNFGAPPSYSAEGGMVTEGSGAAKAPCGEEADGYVVTLADFLENVSLLSNVDVDDDTDVNNKVALMTAHSSKGLEFPYVYIAGLEENIFPSSSMLMSTQDIEEERRLCYVAVTRAKKAVTLSFSATRMRNGSHESNRPSRFIAEIDSRYIENPLDREEFEHRPDFVFGGGMRSPLNYGQSGRAMPDRRPAPQRSVWQNPSRKPQTTPAPRPLPTKSAPAQHNADFPGVPMTQLRVGMRVEHTRFGFGVIKSMTGTAPETKAVIDFDNFGEKLLLLKYAKLRPA